MSVRVQVILDEEEASKFRAQAAKRSRSLSAWLREAGRRALEEEDRAAPLRDPKALEAFFRSRNKREEGREPDWDEHKELILEGARAGGKP